MQHADPTADEPQLIAEARRHVGAPPVGERRGRDPVNSAMIHHWCDALDDRNPAYLDPGIAATTRHAGVVAPPAMLGSWTMDADTAPARGPRDEVLRRLDEAGFDAVVATNYEQEYLRELRPGDHLSETLTVEAMSERKDTALGTGYFVTVRHDYRDAAGELVGVARMRLLKFKAPARPGRTAPPAAAAAAPARPQPPVNLDNAFFWEGVQAGQLLIQRCTSCQTLRHPPRPMCAACRSTQWDTVQSSGRGRIYSYAVHHHPPLPGIDLPLVVVLVELEEGTRIVSNLVDADPDTVAVGQAVELTFRAAGDELTLPVFRLLEGVPA